MDQLNSFLRECVYYPCSGLHGTPMKFLSGRFSNFFYCDYAVTKEEFQRKLHSRGLKGYQPIEQHALDPVEVFGLRWGEFQKENEGTYSRLHFNSSDPFITLCIFQREAGLTGEHGPGRVQLIFARAEAIAALDAVFTRRGISPRCLVHVRSGIGFGGNFSDYPRLLEQSLRNNPGGVPQFILHDSMAVGSGGDHLKLINDYQEVQRWGYPDGGYLRLVERAGEFTAEVPLP